jgi:hypothetical protein
MVMPRAARKGRRDNIAHGKPVRGALHREAEQGMGCLVGRPVERGDVPLYRLRAHDADAHAVGNLYVNGLRMVVNARRDLDGRPYLARNERAVEAVQRRLHRREVWRWHIKCCIFFHNVEIYSLFN